MPKMDARVNLRLDVETLKPYQTLGELITKAGIPMTATQLIRTLVEAQVEQVEYLCEYAERALGGDRGAATELFGKIMDWNQAQIDVARAAETRTEYPDKQSA